MKRWGDALIHKCFKEVFTLYHSSNRFIVVTKIRTGTFQIIKNYSFSVRTSPILSISKLKPILLKSLILQMTVVCLTTINHRVIITMNCMDGFCISKILIRSKSKEWKKNFSHKKTFVWLVLFPWFLYNTWCLDVILIFCSLFLVI